MRFRLRAIGLALVLLAVDSRADDVDEIRRLDKEITMATWTADAQWFQKNVADDYVLIAPNGIVRTRIDVIRELATPGLKMEPYEPLEVQIRVYGDSAVVTGRILQRFTLGRIRYANDLRYTDVWVKRKGKWLLVTGHTSNVAVRR